jgi:holliday junction DNA helicase RuvA
MISYLCGTIQAISGKHTIIDVNGVGYRVALPEKSLTSIAKIGSQVKVFTHYNMSPRDGSVELYGFETPEELNFFELLTSVSGIGPKSAQAILSAADLSTLQLGILRGDSDYLRKTAGIGEKTAQRLIIELKNKIAAIDIAVKDGEFESENDAIEALVMLGYSRFQARDALKQIASRGKNMTSEDKIKESLKILGSRK